MPQQYQQKQEKVNEQQKSVRKRKILMKQKCNYIDHQISLNVSKLDELMSMIKAKKQQQKVGLSTINQVQQSINITSQDTVQIEQKQTEIQKQRRLKFKYSILRQYQFTENGLEFLQKDQLKQQQQHDRNEMIESQQQSTMAENQHNLLLESVQQQQLLQGFAQQKQTKQKSHGLTKLSSKLSTMSLTITNGLQQFVYQQLNEIQSIRIETRYQWISNYLDCSSEGSSIGIDKDTIVKGRAVDIKGGESNQIEVLSFNKKLDLFQCRLIKSESMKQKNSQQQNTIINYTYNQFIHINPEIQITFPKHTHSIKIIHPQIQQVIKLDLLNLQKNIRILLKTQNKNLNNMQRIMIFKQLPSTNSNKNDDQKYKIVWTKYDKMSFVEDVALQGGWNYLVTNLCCHPSSEVRLIFNPKDIDKIKIKRTKYDPWKSYNILCSSFQQCSKVFMSQNVFDDSKPLEFLRSNFLDYGLVLEIYQNIYAEKVAFLDMKQKPESHEEDIQLLFPQIYTQLQNKNIYLPQELVIKFFQVTEKPARLYFPQKRVLIGSKIAQHVTIHSTFK